jgi:hypothetical protein
MKGREREGETQREGEGERERDRAGREKRGREREERNTAGGERRVDGREREREREEGRGAERELDQKEEGWARGAGKEIEGKRRASESQFGRPMAPCHNERRCAWGPLAPKPAGRNGRPAAAKAEVGPPPRARPPQRARPHTCMCAQSTLRSRPCGVSKACEPRVAPPKNHILPPRLFANRTPKKKLPPLTANPVSTQLPSPGGSAPLCKPHPHTQAASSPPGPAPGQLHTT